MTLRIVTYNVSGGLDIGAAAAVLAALHPQVVCILEAPGAKRLRRLARDAGLEVGARADRRAGGTALLVDEDEVTVRSTSSVELSTPRGVRTRSVTQAIVSSRGLRLSVVALQLGLRPDVRRTNLDELSAFVGSIDAATVIGADLNESVRGPVATELATRYQDAFAVAGTGDGATYPVGDPSTRQDFVFVAPSVEVRAAHVPSAAPVDVASHHRPVVADLARPAAAATDPTTTETP